MIKKKIFRCINCGKEELDIEDPYSDKKCSVCGSQMEIVKGELQATLQ